MYTRRRFVVAVLGLAALALLLGGTTGVRASVMLGTSNPPGTPLTMNASTTSGPMFVNVVSNNFPNDIMEGWFITLNIVPRAGTTGTLTFQHPATGLAPNPPNYIFDGHGTGITVTNGGTTLVAFDVDATTGTVVPATVRNLLQMDFLASPGASGLFDIVAVEGAGKNLWTDSNSNNQLFSNVPLGTGTVLIGDVSVSPATIPEPSSLALLALGGGALAGWRRWRKRTA